MCSDHFHPWSPEQGQSGFAWSWLGAALAASNLSFGTVNAPGQRYHPAIIAQAAATLAEMFPGRFWLALGTGQFLNEGITGHNWPAKDLRRIRLRECVEIMRQLWSGKLVTHRGLVTVEEGQLFTITKEAPRLFAAALTEETARWAGTWADGLLTGGSTPEQTRSMIHAFREGGGTGPVYLQVSVLLGKKREDGAFLAHRHWRMNILGAALQAELRSPAQFEAASKFVTPEQVAEQVRISDDPRQHAEWIINDFDAGADAVFLNHVDCDLESAVDFYSGKVAPHLAL